MIKSHEISYPVFQERNMGIVIPGRVRAERNQRDLAGSSGRVGSWRDPGSADLVSMAGCHPEMKSLS